MLICLIYKNQNPSSNLNLKNQEMSNQLFFCYLDRRLEVFDLNKVIIIIF